MLRGLALGLGWLVAAAFIAFGSAGLADGMAHPPGTSARSELTFAGDATMGPELAAARADLEAIAVNADRLGTDARAAVAALTANDTAALAVALDDGESLALIVESSAAGLTTGLGSLPGTGPGEELRVSTALLAQRDAILAGLAGTTGLSDAWSRLASGAAAASSLTGLLLDHDASTAKGAELGRGTRYDEALAQLATSASIIETALQARDELARTADVELLGEWLARNQRYDAALVALYTALRNSDGRVTDAVRAAVKEELDARAQLPPDTRALTIIISELARGGMNQAVIQIEQVRGRIFEAVDATPVETAAPEASPGVP